MQLTPTSHAGNFSLPFKARKQSRRAKRDFYKFLILIFVVHGFTPGGFGACVPTTR